MNNYKIKGYIVFAIMLVSIFMLISIFGCGGGEGEPGEISTDTGNSDGSLTRAITRVEMDPSAYTPKFTVTSDWSSGFCGDITIKNNGSSRINNWQVEFDFNYNITGIWSAKKISQVGNHYVISGESWNSWIEPGASVTFGFQGSPGSVTVYPANWKLTGEVAVISPSPSPSTSPTSSPPPVTGEVLVSYKTASDWGSGFTGEITLENRGTTNIDNWLMTFEFDRSITSIWNATVKSHSGNIYEIKPADYNKAIPAGGKVSFGFVGSPGNVSAGPDNIIVSTSGTPAPSPTPTYSPTPSPTPTYSPTPSPTPTYSPSPSPSPTVVPSPTPTPSPTITPTPSGEKRVVAYFVNWGIYARNYLVTDIPAAKLTHINYAFFAIDSSTGQVKLIDTWADIEKVFTGDTDKGFPDQTWDQSARGEAGCLGRLKQLKAVYPHIKTLMSIGGWTLSYNFPEIASTQAAREKFVTSCVTMMKKYDFDGIDIDWEYPDAANKVNCTLLMAEFRRQLDIQGAADNKHYELSMAGPAGYDKLVNLELDKLANSLDFVNIMTYDFHGGWDNSTNHHSPLYKNPNDPINAVDRELLNTDWTVNYYINAGMPAEKVGMGIPFYGRAWEEVSSTNSGLFQASTKLPDTGQAGNWEAGMLDYWFIRNLVNNPGDYTRHWDDSAKVPWLYGKNLTPSRTIGGMFVTYEDPVSLAGKMEYMKQKGLGGVMFWELSGDIKNSDDPNSLLNVIYQNLK